MDLIFCLCVLIGIFEYFIIIPDFWKRYIKKERIKTDYGFYEYLINTKFKFFLLTIFFFVSVCFLINYDSFIMYKIGNRDINKIPDGKYAYNVKYTYKNTGKTYIVPAVIIKNEGSFYIHSINFSNGGVIHVDDSEPIEINEKRDYTLDDEYEKEYSVVLLNKKTYIPNIKETVNYDIKNFIITILTIIGNGIIWIKGIVYFSKEH